MAKTTVSYSKKTEKVEKDVSFEFYAPLAKEVSLAGTFNNWDASRHSLKKDAAGNWRLSIKLKPGRYEYRYMVDGDWENDQRPVACIPNSFGTWNCVVEVA